MRSLLLFQTQMTNTSPSITLTRKKCNKTWKTHFHETLKVKKSGAYNCTNSLAPRQPEKDLPRWASVADWHSNVTPRFENADFWIRNSKCWHFSNLGTDLFKSRHVQTSATIQWSPSAEVWIVPNFKWRIQNWGCSNLSKGWSLNGHCKRIGKIICSQKV